jgi:DNA-binding NtrC family response regulator
MAGTGKAAMEALNRNAYDLISLDYILPGNLNGMDVYHHIRKTDKTVPVLFISGNIEFLESIKALKQKDPHIEHLSKPCQNIDYVNCINQMLGRSLNR